ncbi:hypothetical protein MHLP_01490 [Candidatus Mycoplasma haematolamae str. Purdue]|uniref:Uncharacterized protein n=1 Tax=Mycoplasma haematolamae (strain Purdue) TaxID=1212765 RepID=I7BJ64_MYCHA|nr:hypothetical protein [Candidatus Mycoplasma haematolamae]AFO51878.1 hypothetical protein MHLP_01490 [Candidatus Mycoplasma haematolamae str. Purdue]
MFKEITVGLGSLGTIGAVGGGSLYGTGVIHDYLYLGEPIEFSFKNGTGDTIRLKCEPLTNRKTFPWLQVAMTSENTAEADCAQFSKYAFKSNIPVWENELQGKKMPPKEGLKCQMSSTYELSCSLNNQKEPIKYKNKTINYEGGGYKNVVELSW